MTEDEIQRSLAELHPASAGWALSCCRWDREEAEEVLQVAYLKILDGRARFGGRSSFRTWLFGVIRRTAAEHRRGRWLRSVVGLRWRDGHPSPPPSPETRLGEAQSSHALRTAPRGGGSDASLRRGGAARPDPPPCARRPPRGPSAGVGGGLRARRIGHLAGSAGPGAAPSRRAVAGRMAFPHRLPARDPGPRPP